MARPIAVVIVAFSVVVVHLAAAEPRWKRSIGQFGDMIRETTKMEALLFNNYGNHCGSQNNPNKTVVDDIDRCCYAHDRCYEDLSRDPCSSSFFGPYFTFYSWSINHGNISCGEEDRCKMATCHCDRTAAYCFARFTYNPAHKKASIWDWLI